LSDALIGFWREMDVNVPLTFNIILNYPVGRWLDVPQDEKCIVASSAGRNRFYSAIAETTIAQLRA
jgi:hypothetical protein